MQRIMWNISTSVAYSTPWVKREETTGFNKEVILVYDSLTARLVRKIVNMDLQCHDVIECIIRWVIL